MPPAGTGIKTGRGKLHSSLGTGFSLEGMGFSFDGTRFSLEGTGFSPYIEGRRMDTGFSPGRICFPYFTRDPEFFRDLLTARRVSP